jgi:nitroimidazol reductase NimA-like FMN-containing flavoprotein (pyridoxamine 5'-phosphate oxidase superfamily)
MIGTLDDTAIETLLQSEVVGRIGCHAGGRTYVIPVSYVYVDGAVYGHTAEGRKVDMMRENPHVCFEVDRVTGAMHWDSVVADAVYEELTAEEAQHAFGLLVERLVPLMAADRNDGDGDGRHDAPGTVMDFAAARPVVFRLRLGQRTGRFQRR